MGHTRVTKSQFKAKVLEYLEQVEASGSTLVITDNGRPALEIRRYRTDQRNPLEILKGSVIESNTALADDDWLVIT